MPRGNACKKKSALVSMIHDSTTMIKKQTLFVLQYLLCEGENLRKAGNGLKRQEQNDEPYYTCLTKKKEGRKEGGKKISVIGT